MANIKSPRQIQNRKKPVCPAGPDRKKRERPGAHQKERRPQKAVPPEGKKRHSGDWQSRGKRNASRAGVAGFDSGHFRRTTHAKGSRRALKIHHYSGAGAASLGSPALQREERPFGRMAVPGGGMRYRYTTSKKGRRGHDLWSPTNHGSEAPPLQE